MLVQFLRLLGLRIVHDEREANQRALQIWTREDPIQCSLLSTLKHHTLRTTHSRSMPSISQTTLTLPSHAGVAEREHAALRSHRKAPRACRRIKCSSHSRTASSEFRRRELSSSATLLSRLQPLASAPDVGQQAGKGSIIAPT